MDEAKFRTLITTFTNELRHELQKPPMSSDENDTFQILNLYNTYAESLGWDTPTPVRVYFITAFYSTAKLLLPLLPVLKPPSPDETCSERCPTSSFNLNTAPEFSVQNPLLLIDTSSPDSSIELEETYYRNFHELTRKDTVEGHFDPVVYFGPFPLLIYKIVFFYSDRLPFCRKLSLLDVSTMLFSIRSCSVII